MWLRSPGGWSSPTTNARRSSGVCNCCGPPEVPGRSPGCRMPVRMVTLTNSSGPTARAQLEHGGLIELFDQVISVDEVRRFKPASEPYLMAAERLGVRPEQMRMVAAYNWDVWGSLRAGCIHLAASDSLRDRRATGHRRFRSRRYGRANPSSRHADTAILGADVRAAVDQVSGHSSRWRYCRHS